MKVLIALLLAAGLALFAYTGIEYLHLYTFFGIIFPYTAFAFFVIGFIFRILKWAKAPVPFNITTTAGQQKSLNWINHSKLENPGNKFEVMIRMALEVLLFRSLFRNTKAGLNKEGNLGYGSEKSLWLFGLLFHWTFLAIGLRHLRFFTDPVPAFLGVIEQFDTLFQIGLPIIYLTDIIFLFAVSFLFLRRVWLPQVRYFSLVADYFPLFIILGIGITGTLMRYITRVDIIAVKQLTMGLATFSPVVPQGIGSLFFIHFFLVSFLFFYFPFSKLMHMGGVFFSPTRNLPGNSRVKRHVNPWDYPVKVHTYQEYEDDYRDLMKGAGLPVEKE